MITQTMVQPSASRIVQSRIEALLAKQQDDTLTPAEEEELDCYEEIDDYLSFVNRTVRNISEGILKVRSFVA
jgi:uncharacterized protein YnzC (UPF0291/DUF896 family)